MEHRRKKASPARGGGCAAGADGGVALPRCLFRYLSGLRQACAGADDFHRPGEGGGCRKARGTMRASSPTNARQGPAGVCGVSLPPGGDAPRRRRRRDAAPCRGFTPAGCLRCARRERRLHQPALSAPRTGSGTMRASSPTHARACRVLQDISAAGRRCTPQSADADSSPCRGAFGKLPQKSLPCKGRWTRRRRRRRGAAPLPGLYACGMFALRAGRRALSNS